MPLSRLIDVINERFGTDFNEADQLFFEQVVEAAVRLDSLQQAAQANPLDKFLVVLQQMLESLLIERVDLNGEIVSRYISDAELQKVIAQGIGREVYERISRAAMTAGAPHAEG